MTDRSDSLEPLPIDGVLPRVLASLEDKPCLVLRAETGAGKTTRVPPALLATCWRRQHGGGRILVLEPRRVAARAAARRIAQERTWTVGDEVGFQVRFDRRFHDGTPLVLVTEGILVRKLQSDPFLEDVAAVVFDEFHERNLHSDLSLAMCRKVQQEARPELRLILMSATLDPEPLVEYLGEDATSVVDSPGRQHPVVVEYLTQTEERPIHVTARAGIQRMLEAVAGDLLVFLPGIGEIRRTADALESLARRADLDVVPLFGDLPPEQQDQALRAGSRRRVVLATNVAETSVTVEGIEAVVDTGLARTMRYDPSYGLDRLELGRISRASAEQRKGRAGRLGPGECLRLWTEHDHLGLRERQVPEIQRVDLSSSMLELLSWGESEPRTFPWLDSPEPAVVDRALALLEDLGATDGGKLTDIGRALARLPLQPRLARLLVAGHDLGVLRRAARIAAILSERDLVSRPAGSSPAAARSTPSDVLDRLEALEDWERRNHGETALGPVSSSRCRHVLRVAKQLESAASQALRKPPRSVEVDPDEAVLRSLLAAYPDRVSRRRSPGSEQAVMVGGRGVRLSDASSVRDGDLFVAIELSAARSGSHSHSLVRQASRIERRWLERHLQTEDVALWDGDSQRARGLRRTRYRDLVLDEVEIDPGPDEASRLLAEAAVADPSRAFDFQDRPVADFLARIRSLRQWIPELNLPSFEGRHFEIEVLPHLVAGRRSFADLRRAPLLDVMKGTLDYEQRRALERDAPERLPIPSGSQIRLDYGSGEPGSPPILAARIQELFGLAETPTVAGGRVQVLMHLLAPNMRPQQVTRDLKSFWKNTYPEVRKELAGRYPSTTGPKIPPRRWLASDRAGRSEGATASIRSMRIHVVAFATASDVLGRGPTEIELPDGARLSTLRDHLFERHPRLEELWPRLAVAVDGALTKDDPELTAGVEVALLPPVSGGAQPLDSIDP
ncbi:MAG: ATP-dependent helicase HrpB [Thermoanaerobaculia bacterium]|nr:ATP-dependent helicase HrpB [Thermoanaerobaculia bacterium]